MDIDIISVIIPCYNVEDYIDRCMESVTLQTIGMEHLQIILVNDASCDSTLKKLEEWERKFPEQIIVVTYEENLRQGGARNVGLQYVSGKYIGFVDADDWIERDMYELLYYKAVEGNYDRVSGKFIREEQGGGNSQYENGKKRLDVEHHCTPIQGFCMQDCTEIGNQGEYGSICTAIYRSSIILENKIYFPEKMAYEDNYWGAIASLYIEDSYIVDKVLYHYMANADSTTSSRNRKYHLDRLKIEMMKIDKYESLGVLEIPEFKEQIEWDFLQRYYLNSLFVFFTRFEAVPAEIVNIMIRTVRMRFPDWEKNSNIKNQGILNKLLLEMLKTDGKLTQEEVGNIGTLYINAWKSCNEIE